MSDKKKYIVLAASTESPQIKKLLKDSEYGFFECGVGIFESMVRFGDFVKEKSPSEIILLGTAGSFYKEDIFRLVVTNQFSFPKYQGEEIPEFLNSSWYTRPAISTEENIAVFSGFGVSMSRNFQKDFQGWENMEAAGLSYICQQRDIRFSALLCCTNQIGPMARKQWKKNYKKAGDLLLNQVRKLL